MLLEERLILPKGFEAVVRQLVEVLFKQQAAFTEQIWELHGNYSGVVGVAKKAHFGIELEGSFFVR